MWSTAPIEAANAQYWHSYWQRASVSLPAQPNIERFWYVANYMLGSVSRPAPKRFGGSTFPNLWGPWITDGFKGAPGGGCGWCSACVSDYNAESVLYGAFASNKLEQVTSYEDLVTAFLPAARAGALSTARFAAAHSPNRNASLAQCVEDAPNAIHFPCGIAPFGMPSGGNGPSPVRNPHPILT